MLIRGEMMKTQCMICEKIEEIDGDSLLAKKLKYNRIRSYLCDECYKRIKIKTIKRHETGNFHLYSDKQKSKNK